MLRNGHVRFGGRPAETHQFKDWQGAAGRPYTYVHTFSGWVYVAFVTDVFNREIVGWRTSRSLHTDLALDALNMAIYLRKREGADLSGLIHHSDRGVQGAFCFYSPQLRLLVPISTMLSVRLLQLQQRQHAKTPVRAAGGISPCQDDSAGLTCYEPDRPVGPITAGSLVRYRAHHEGGCGSGQRRVVLILRS